MKQKTVCFYTLGCKVNQYETNAMAQKFADSGYKVVEEGQKADIAIVNTCTVTNMADRKSRQLLRKIKKMNPYAVLVAVGCYVQVAKEKVEAIPEIDLVLGNNEKQDIIEYVEKYIKEQNKLNEVTDVMHQKEFVDLGIIIYTEQTRAVIKIQDGCDRFCSYCIIPYARGRVRSRKPKKIIEEVKKLVDKGLKEIVITGIHVASYGKDFEEDYRLLDLLEELNKIDNLERIRLSSLEPMIITDEFVVRLKKLEKICHHFHLSLQSGCDETLKRMNRRYTTAEFMQVVARIRKAYKDVSLTTDIIVGFPGETGEEFEKTYNFLKKIKFYKMHVFKYSQREGTQASVMPDQIDGKVKEERSQRLIMLSNQNEKDYNKQYIGKDVEVLFEEREGKYYKGHTANYIVVKYETEEELENCLKVVRVVEQREDYLIAK